MFTTHRGANPWRGAEGTCATPSVAPLMLNQIKVYNASKCEFFSDF